MDEFIKSRSRTWAQIDLDIVLANFRAARAKLPSDTELYAVIKADAYGHGANVIGRLLEGEGKADGFCVATIDEALALRHGGITRPVLILGYSEPHRFPELFEFSDIYPTIYSLTDARALGAAAAAAGQCAPAFLALDTGMGRIGLSCDTAGLDEAELICGLDGVCIKGIFSHFARADETDKAAAVLQAKRFEGFYNSLVARGIKIPKRSTYNSAAISAPDFSASYEIARVGITLYGLHPSPDVHSSDYTPALSFKTRVVQIKTVPAGTGISYGHTFVTTRETRVATLCVGYADGYPRLLSGAARVIIGSHYAPVIGRVCMDMMMIDVTELPEVALGDTVTLIGRDGECEITADLLAESIGTIGYELVCGISSRVPRIYLRGGKPVKQ